MQGMGAPAWRALMATSLPLLLHLATVTTAGAAGAAGALAPPPAGRPAGGDLGAAIAAVLGLVATLKNDDVTPTAATEAGGEGGDPPL